MSRPLQLLLVAVASFAIGALFDRVVFSGSDPHPADEETENANEATRAGARSTPSSRTRNGQAASAKGRQGKRNNNRDREDPIPESIRTVLHELSRGGHMDAATANRLIEDLPPGPQRREVLHRLGHHWARQDPESAAAWAVTLEGRDRRHALESALHGWSENDPEGAARFVVELPTSEQNLHMVHAMAHRWGERDREAALSWSSNLQNPALRERAMGGVVGAWGDHDPKQAAEFAASIGSYYERHRVLDVAARRWAMKDTAEALEWAGDLPVQERQRATRSVLREVAEHDPERAANLYNDLTANSDRPDREYRRMAEEIAHIWSSNNPQDAAEWAVNLPETSEIQRSAVQSVAERWLRMDPEAAGEWILQLPEGRTRDAASDRVVERTIHSDPSTAFQWASSMHDEGHRTGAMRNVLDRWNSTDSSAARAAFEGATNLSPHQREELGEVFGRQNEE